jgi:hypothetical protein
MGDKEPRGKRNTVKTVRVFKHCFHACCLVIYKARSRNAQTAHSCFSCPRLFKKLQRG